MRAVLLTICSIVLLTSGSWAQSTETANVEVLSKTSSSWDGRALPEYPKGAPEITILRITIPPGMELPLHKHPVINAGVMLKGQLVVITGEGETLHLEAGDAIVEVVDKWHYGKNEGNEPAEIIVFYAGLEGRSITDKK
jgi:quercetin dioxygenase-like cupin family protein